MRIRFITSTPLDIRRGSGTYVGMAVLARAIERLGHQVEWATPRVRLPVYTLERLVFNRRLAPSAGFDLTVGFDLDGYRIAGGATHVAALKGVIADEARFESGLTRVTMNWQARRERLHAQRAARVLAPSLYSAERAAELYGLAAMPAVIPEPIELARWQALLAANPAAAAGRFTVLFVGRLYRRKRVDVLLRAAALLRRRIPELEVRVVGAGPCAASLRRLAEELRLRDTVTWLDDVPRQRLAAEYNRACLFCLPSQQEAFGIVLLEAMAAGKPIVAARAAAIPEVAPSATLVEPGSPEALAAAIATLYRAPEARLQAAREGLRRVEAYDAPRVAELFLQAAVGTAPMLSGTPA